MSSCAYLERSRGLIVLLRWQEASISGTLHRLVQEEGWGALYRGISPELFRGVLSAAIMLAFKEKIFAFNKRLLTPA
jgi:hypothetical protein